MGEKTPVKEQSTRSQGLGLPASADAKGYVGEVFISSNEEDAAGGESGDFVHHLQLKGGGGMGGCGRLILRKCIRDR